MAYERYEIMKGETFFGKSIFRLGKMLTSVKIEHLNSSIKNSEFRFRLIAVPFVKDSKIQEHRN